jgi:hypothetical protein
MERSLPIVADIPTASPGLGFQEYVEALADAVRGGSPPQFTIGLYGAWGSGKSSLLKAMANALQGPGSETLPVIFDAWRHERADHIIVPLLYRIQVEAKRAGDTALTEHLGRALRALVFSLNFKVAGFGVDTKAAKENWDAEEISLDDAFAKPYEEMRRLPETLAGKRIVVLVDDLDRCSPEKVVSLLEAINLVMDIPGFIFVLALDYDVLVHAVTAKYPHVSGHEFIEKMIQLPFRVPPLSVESDQFLDALIPEWDRRRDEFPEGFAASLSDIAALGLRTNPRQIKRLINSFLVLERIAEQRELGLDRDLMAALIGLQLRWPDEFKELQDAVLVDEPKPFDALDGENVDLTRYRERFFESGCEIHELRQIMQLTAVVAPEPVNEKPSVRQVREEMREELIAALPTRGFKMSPRSERIWYHASAKDRRVVLTKIGFRSERLGSDGDWTLQQSFDYRQVPAGLEWIDALLVRTREAGLSGSH